MSYAVVQECPVPKKLAPLLRKALAKSGATLQSCYRGDDARRLLNRLGKQSQQQLWDGFREHRPGYNPANPPGYSTHELRNDGLAFTRWPRGHRIPWWAVGIDIDDAHVMAFIHAARSMGWQVQRTYPLSKGEYHHVNFRKPPVWHRIRATFSR